MKKHFLHNKFFESNSRFYPALGNIQSYTETRDDHNAVVKTWEDKIKEIQCAIGTIESTKRGADMTVQEATHSIILTGRYEEISKGDQFYTDSERFEIMEVRQDNMGILTQLHVKKIKLK